MLAYAIDFGTSNSLLAAAEAGKIHAPIPLDPNAKDPTVLRSLMYFPSMKKVFYGSDAIRQFTDHQGEGRLMRSLKKHLPIRSFIGTWIEERPVNLEDLIGFFLSEMRNRANAHFGQDVTTVVLGRPAKFSADLVEDSFAQFRLERSAKNAGFKEIEFVPEPLAAAFAFRSQLTEEKVVLVADFGGGTSDFTVLKIGPHTYNSKDVLSIGGVSVAGDILDGAVMRHKLAPHFGADLTYTVPFGENVLRLPGHLIEKICSPADVSILQRRDLREFLRQIQQWVGNPESNKQLQRLLCLIDDQLGFPLFEQIEKGKRQLSNVDKTLIEYNYPGIEVSESLTRSEFEAMISESVGKIMGR